MIYLPPPATVVDITTLMKSAQLLFYKPVAPVKLQLRLFSNSLRKGTFKGLVMRKLKNLFTGLLMGYSLGEFFFLLCF